VLEEVWGAEQKVNLINLADHLRPAFGRDAPELVLLRWRRDLGCFLSPGNPSFGIIFGVAPHGEEKQEVPLIALGVTPP
jgi:hypothetical protein